MNICIVTPSPRRISNDETLWYRLYSSEDHIRILSTNTGRDMIGRIPVWPLTLSPYLKSKLSQKALIFSLKFSLNTALTDHVIVHLNTEEFLTNLMAMDPDIRGFIC